MRKIQLVLFFTLVLGEMVSAQFVYHSADQFPIIGKITAHTETRYERLDKSLKTKVARPFLWTLGKNTAGLAIRFSSNAQQLAFKWTVLDNVQLQHMSPTGVKGLDLYVLSKNEKWCFVNSAQPAKGKESQAIISTQNNDDGLQEYMLYLPLYDGLSELSIGVKPEYQIDSPKVNKPTYGEAIVWYGTSITQGGCASRPGMAHTNILSRWLGREIINMGFSGNGQLDLELADLIADYPASLFIIDCMPNVNADIVHDRLKCFYQTIRVKNKQTPILFISNPEFPSLSYESSLQNDVKLKNSALLEVFNEIKAKDEQVYFLSASQFLGEDGEATVDGIHFTDLGFMRCAELMFPILKDLVNEK